MYKGPIYSIVNEDGNISEQEKSLLVILCCIIYFIIFDYTMFAFYKFVILYFTSSFFVFIVLECM